MGQHSIAGCVPMLRSVAAAVVSWQRFSALPAFAYVRCRTKLCFEVDFFLALFVLDASKGLAFGYRGGKANRIKGLI
jgi:hypothetical protein